MKQLLDYIPLIAFFVAYQLADIYMATIALMVTTVVQVAGHYLIEKKVSKLHLGILGMVMIFGALTLLFRDDQFLKWKVTIINLAFAIALIGSCLLKKPLMALLLGQQIGLSERAWQKLTYAWGGFFAFIAASNLVVAYQFDQATWVNFKVFGILVMTLIFAVLTAIYVAKANPETNISDDQSS